jgi:FKBP-type peptidyl-prolyl cis-trans isomerase
MESISYALGVLFADNLKQQGISNINADELATALAAQLEGKADLSPEQANEIVGKIMQEKQAIAGEEARVASEDFLAKNAKTDGVIITPSGLQYTAIQLGKGATPVASDKVTVHYSGSLIDGTVFDSSYERGTPASFPLEGVIPGWTEGLQLMKVGGKTRFFIPQDLAYGDRPNPNSPIPAYAALVFDVELISVD